MIIAFNVDKHIIDSSHSSRMMNSIQEPLQFRLADWEALVEDAGLLERIDMDKVKLVFLQARTYS